ncbi:unnamed protein product [Brachionus calyciflorus]|uniref:Uncharacterized protein n=1 Tax=Brachionus calyciflorus TaxID=104777 RepID=A0A814J6E4_9BILA|nr:unnamed protein product [Brachionus calyciflorus]
MVAHSRSLKENSKNLNETNDDEFEIDDDDDESESSFILMYQLIYDKSLNIFLNQNDSYMMYEGIGNCSVVFEHEFSLNTLKCIKTNYESLSEMFKNEECSNSRIISIETISILNNRFQLDMACVIWALADKKSTSSDNFFLSIFNLNNWYVQCMPSEMRMENETSSRKNAFFTNYTLAINCDLDAIKFIKLIDTKIRKVKNQNSLSVGNSLRKLIMSTSESLDDTIGYDFDEETYLSMSFDLMMLTPFTLTKLSIKPIEHQIHQFISQQDDLIHYPEKVYFLLTRYHLIDKFITDDSQPKFIPIFNYLLETSQIYAILKSLWKLHSEDTSIISDLSLKSVLDWSWSKVCSIKKELNNLNKKITIQLKNHFARCLHGNDLIEKENLTEFLNRENNLLDNLIQIFKQFLKLDTTQDGYAQLNKKLCIIESIKCYVEHLALFNKFELLLPPSLTSQDTSLNDSCLFRNYINEMEVNFKLIQSRWTTRHQEQQSNIKTDKKYPFTYIIDCLIEECKSFANTSKLFVKPVHKKVKFSDEKQEPIINQFVYPPKSLLELLEVCLECNLSTKMKQILILYVLCDLMHTEMSESVRKHMLKVINAYCSTSFTIMSTSLDAAISVPWSSSVTSIVSLSTDPDDPNYSSCLFDLVNGLYLIDSHFMERAFKYLRGIDVNYLEFYEKYFILYNSVSLNEYKIAAQYLWLFQKLNVSSISTTPANDLLTSKTISSQMDSDLALFNFFPKSNTNLTELNSQSLQNKLKHEQIMHSRLILTIYLANSLVNEAYDLIKPHVLQIKSSGSLANKLSKELLIHFFTEAEKFKQWKQLIKLTSIDSDFLLILLNYLEAKKDTDSIGRAIDLHVNNRNYKKAIQLYEKYHQQISTSADFSYLSSMIDIAKEMQNDYTSNALFSDNNQYNLISQQDLK